MRNRITILALMVLVVLTYGATAMAGELCGKPWLPPCPKKIFVTSLATYTGALGGLAGADNICQGLAATAKLKGTYKAWLSGGAAGEAVRERFTFAQVPYVDTCIVPHIIAQDATELLSGTLQYPVTCDETHRKVPMLQTVWTGTDSFGHAANFNNFLHFQTYCDAWTTGDLEELAVYGVAGARDFQWTGTAQSFSRPEGAFDGPCSAQRALYCVEQ